MAGQRGAPVTLNAVSWLLTQSGAQRGRVEPVERTCANYLAFVTLMNGSGVAGTAGRTKLLLRVAYPEPTPVSVVAALSIPQFGTIPNSFTPKLPAWPPTATAVVAPVYQAEVGALIVEWILAGAQFSAVLDLGGGGLSIPACDQVTVSYAAFVTPGAWNVQLSILPVWMPGLLGTRTGIPALVPVGGSEVYDGRQNFARRWRLTAAENVFPLVPGPIGPLAVRMIDTQSIGDSSEVVEFVPGAAAGLRADSQGWIECGAMVKTYQVFNLGAVAVKAHPVEQIQVA